MVRKAPEYDNATPEYRAALKAEALRLAALGIPTFPANVRKSVDPKTGEVERKVYPCADWDTSATTDPKRIARVWDSGAWNALCMPTGVPTPFGRLVVIDGDRHGAGDGVAELERMDVTSVVEVDTPSGGRHVFTVHREDDARPCPRNSVSALAVAVDVRGEGGFVIVAPTVDFRGAYSVRDAALDTETLAKLPPAPDGAYKARPAPAQGRGAVERTPSGRLVVAGDFEVVDPWTGEITVIGVPGKLFTMEQAVAFCAPLLYRLRAVPYKQGINHALNDAALTMSHFVGDFWDEAFVTKVCMEAQLRPGWSRSGKGWETALGTVRSALTSAARFEWTAELAEDAVDALAAPGADEDPFEDEDDVRPAPGAWRAGSTDPVPTWHAFAIDPPLYRVNAAGVAALPVHERDVALDAAFAPGAPGNLPPAFFDARPVFGHIRDVAYARGTGATSTFMCAMATIAALVSPKIKVDTGMMSSTGLQTYVAMVAPSGVGKSASKDVSAMVVPHLPDRGLDDLHGTSVSTGQGMLAHFIGKIAPLKPPPKPAGENDDIETVGDGEGDEDDEPAERKPKIGQVKWHGLFYIDEGGLIFEHGARKDSILASIVKQMWHGRGETPNATEELRRKVDDAAVGLMAGFQVGDMPTVGPLLADDSGLVQRFVLCSAADPDRPRRRTPMPAAGARLANAAFTLDVTGDWDGVLHLPAEATEELEDRMAWLNMPEAQRTGGMFEGVFEDGRDAHWPLHAARWAGLFALMDNRQHITMADWRLAKVVLDMSSTYRRGLMGALRAVEDAKHERAQERAVQTAVAVDNAVAASGEAREQTKAERDTVRVAKTVAKWCNDPSAPVTTRKALRGKLSSPDRTVLDAAIEYAAGKGWITREGTAFGPRSATTATPAQADADIELA